MYDFQKAVGQWVIKAFGYKIAEDTVERNHRFLEEALELVQSGGTTKEEALQLVDYVYGRPVGEQQQEVGGVMVTLAALCEAYGIDLETCSFEELERVYEKIEQIRIKQAGKPKSGPLPQ